MDQLVMGGMGLQTAALFGKRSLARASGDAVARTAEIEAQQEELGGIAREADRKERLVSALASQIASAGTKNISAFEGSPLNILEADIEREEKETERDAFSTKLAAFTKRSTGRMNRSIIKRGADIDFVSGAGSLGMQGAQAASVLGGKK